MHDIQTSSESYDGLFLGSSVAWYSLDPAIWQYELGLRFFNMGMNSQSLFATNAVLETVLQTQSPKYCVYGMHWFFLTYTKQEMHISEMSAVTNRVYDQMKPSAAKIHMFWNSVASEELVRMVLPFTRDAQSNIAAVLQTKASEGYRTYTSFRTENVNRNGYIGDGFAIRHRGMEQGMVGSACTESLKPRLHSTLSSAAAQELLAMKKLCQRNGVQLVIIVPPVTRAHMAQMGGQSEIEALFDEARAILGSDVPFIDFSYCREDFLCFEDSDYTDYTHLNYIGAQKFSTAAAELFKRIVLEGENVDLSQYFYPTFDDMMAHNADIFNAWLEITDGVATARCTCGGLAAPEYEFSYAPLDEMPFEIVREYSQDNVLELSSLPYSKGFLRVSVRPVGSDEAYQQRWTMEVPQE